MLRDHARLVVTLGLMLALGARAVHAQTPPGQPASGPGGSDYPHAGYTVVTSGSGNLQYWVYQPASPKPASAPLIVFNHGYAATEPTYYLAWIEHLVRRGNVVVYPRYQASLLTRPATYTANAITAVKNAIAWLQASATRVQPQLSRFAIVGHSYGGVVTVNMAHRWQASGLPQPRAVMPTEPYSENLDALSGIPATALLNCIVADEDATVGRAGCDLIWDRTGQIPLANRDYVWMSSDRYGAPDLVANHRQACTGGASDCIVDALDWYGSWKIFDALTDCAFFALDCEYALGNTAEHRDMGTWSNGQPVVELEIFDAKP